MAVYTDIDDEDLAGLLADYDIGSPLALKGIAEGVENSNYFLQTTTGRFFLTLYEKRVSADDLPFFLGLLDHLAARGVTCPTPVHGKDGEIVRQVAGRPAALVTFLDGVSIRHPTPEHCAEAGAALARLHAAGKDFPRRRRNALSLAGWQDLTNTMPDAADQVAAGLKDLVKSEIAALTVDWPAGLPQGIIHADMFPDNTLFVGNRLTGVIDFYFACSDALAYDVAVCLNAWCFGDDGAFDVTKSKAILAGYQSGRQLSAVEIAALPILARGAALRFLLTRLHDWLNRTPGALVRLKDPLEYLGKLRFHQTATSAAVYGA